jgi:DNA primase
MIKQSTIELIRQLDASQVIGKYINLDKHNKACCPFHDEKTPSFSVSDKLGVYKCFGCGEAGNAIKFVQDHCNKTFPEAVEEIASNHGITVEYEDDISGEKRAEFKKKKLSLNEINETALKTFVGFRPNAKEYLEHRGIDNKTAASFQIGLASENKRTLTDLFTHKGVFKLALELGLVKEKEGYNHDTFINRLIFPIHDASGQLVGFGGRTLDDEFKPKYLNSSDSVLYNKSRVLYNLNRAAPFIKEAGRLVILTEGYTDVVSLWQHEIKNVVASCGTSFTLDQAKLLKRYADLVIVWFDGDSAGKENTLKAIKVLAQAGLSIKVFNADGEDPDSFVRQYSERVNEDTGEIELLELNLSKKAIGWFDWSYSYLFDGVKDIEEKDKRLNRMMAVVACFNSMVQEEYTKILTKKLRLTKKVVKDRLISSAPKPDKPKERVVDEDTHFLPRNCDQDFYARYGFAPKEDGTGYYFTSGRGYEEIGNFTLKPLFHIHGEDSKRFVELRKGKITRQVLWDSKVFSSVQSFDTALWDEQMVFAGGAKKHLDMLKMYWSDRFPTCFELHRLGWQPEGFFAFSNKVYNGTLGEYDELGIYNHKDVNFLSPSITEELKGKRDTENLYENDKYLEYKQSPIDFTTWAKLFNDVYPDHALYAIPFIFLTIFKDIATRRANVPFLYAYGKTEAGKSQFAESILHFFFSGKNAEGHLMKGFNLSEGTNYALASYIERFYNTPALFNEFDDNLMPADRFPIFKAFYDGEGRQKGAGVKNKVITQKVNCTGVLAGQYLVTTDDNSIVNRSVLCSFKQRDFSKEERERFSKLKNYEDQGISSLVCEILKFRDVVLNNYDVQFEKTVELFKQELATADVPISNRIRQNYSHLYTMLVILEQYLQLPFTSKDVLEQYKSAIYNASKLIKESDSMGEFWRYVQLMANEEIIELGYDVKVEYLTSIEIGSDKYKKRIDFPEVTPILFLRSQSDVELQYGSEYRKRTGKPGMSWNNLKKYLQESDAYIGRNATSDYRGKKHSKRTSGYVFYYNKLGINLESEAPKEKPTELTLEIVSEVHKDEVLGKTQLKFKAIYQTDTKEIQRASCEFFDETGKGDNLKEGDRIDATGLLEKKSFKNSSGERIEYMKYTIHNILKTHQEPQPTQGELPMGQSSSDEPQDDLPF